MSNNIVQKGKPCAVIYSGGKDGHLALLRALADGRRVACLMHIDAGVRHTLCFNDLRRVPALREHSRLSGLPLFIYKAGPAFEPKKFEMALGALIGAAAAKYEFEDVYSGSSDHDDGITAKKLAVFSRALGIKIRTPLGHCRLEDNIAEMRRRGVRAVIVGVDRKVSPFWLGKPLNDSFIAYIGMMRSRGVAIGGPEIQTLVTDSPLFSAPLKLEPAGVFRENANTFWGFRVAKRGGAEGRRRGSQGCGRGG